jgi:hypothetical protein
MFICDVLAYKLNNYGEHNKELLIIQLIYITQMALLNYGLKAVCDNVTVAMNANGSRILTCESAMLSKAL